VLKGSPHAHFQRAIERRHLLSAETAARELPQPLNLGDAFAFLLLIAEFDPDRYGRAAARWHGRFVVECGVSLEDATLALAALTSIGSSEAALNVLAELGARYRVANIGAALRRFRRGDVAAQAGENIGRLRDEAAFARICAAAPIEVSSGRPRRHRSTSGGRPAGQPCSAHDRRLPAASLRAHAGLRAETQRRGSE
jgi:hypothetical protein